MEAELVFSTASVQELAYLAARGRVIVDRSIRRWIVDALRVHEVQVLPSTLSIALRAGSLDPTEFHGDPIDRLIYATAVEHDAQLVTADRRLREVDPARVIW
jgi:PIN domain nuclease of toxin-antitoxin system